MNKFEIKKLKCGIILIYCKDKSKHITSITIATKFGGRYSNLIIDGKEQKVKHGIAHFIEHYLIEQSRFGNAIGYFLDKYLQFNGATSALETDFYIDTPFDYENVLKDLLVIVNKPDFTEEKIEKIKQPILDEIRKKDDEKYFKFYKITENAIFNSREELGNLGTVDEIKDLKKEEIELCYNAFYKPENQVICISGPIDEEKVISIINEFYKDYKKDFNASLNEPIEKLPVNKKYDEIKEDVFDDTTTLAYKMKIDGLTSKDIDKAITYYTMFIRYNFSGTSGFHDELYKEDIAKTDVSISVKEDSGYILIKFTGEILDIDKFKKHVLKRLEKKYIDKEYFEISKKEEIINLIIMEDNPHKKAGYQFNLYLSNDVTDEITYKDAEKYSYEECMEYVNKLTFDNYCITRILRNK